MRKEGFTLLELLIVIAVIAGLATVFMSTFPASQKRGRDTKRRSDLKQYQTAMEIYANKSGSYPDSGGPANPSANAYCVTQLALTTCPDDPKSTQHYSVNSVAGSYALWGQLEQPLAATGYFVLCSDGRVGECAAAPTSSACAVGCP